MGINIRRNELIYPYFVIEGKNKKQEIKNFPGVPRLSIDRLLADIEETQNLGIKKILLFGIPGDKDKYGSGAYKDGNIIAKAIREIKKEFPELIVMTDVCLCAYTTHGHCGIIKSQKAKVKSKKKTLIDNAQTLKTLSKIALSHAEAGADWVAPSAMAQGQVAMIRKALDKSGFRKTKILGYSAKFASNFYGPFRQAAGSAPAFGDRGGYQLDFHDPKNALREIAQDIKEGADAVMVKPALSYLDIIREARMSLRGGPLRFARGRLRPTKQSQKRDCFALRARNDVPFLAAYNTSGEYSFVKYGAIKGLWDEKKMVFEIITAIKRAGADLIITYHAKDIAVWQKTGDGSLFFEERNPPKKKRTVPII